MLASMKYNQSTNIFPAEYVLLFNQYKFTRVNEGEIKDNHKDVMTKRLRRDKKMEEGKKD